ncbi:MAG TPA: hypothetical protein VG604_04340 [Candidatus Saccharimonadales bacterium]|nr:hypothetical protein [Candidatus Saccharimonadales bacterium]
MQENDPLAHQYDFSKIAVDSAREQSRREAVQALSAAVEASQTTAVARTEAITNAFSGVMMMGTRFTTSGGELSLTLAYDEFKSQDGAVIESRILRIATGRRSRADIFSGFGHYDEGSMMSSLLSRMTGSNGSENQDEVFLLAPMSKGQETITNNNLKFGALLTGEGVTEFFKLLPLNQVAEADQPLKVRLMLGSARIEDSLAQQMVVGVRLSPVEEQSLAFEFTSAAAKLKAMAPVPKKTLPSPSSYLLPGIKDRHHDHPAAHRYDGFGKLPELPELIQRPAITYIIPPKDLDSKIHKETIVPVEPEDPSNDDSATPPAKDPEA